MEIRVEKKEYRKKRATYSMVALFSIFFSLFSIFSFHLQAQDSIPLASGLSEEKELKFQEFFFKALSEKAITNYKKAIENLEECNQILPNNVAVYFEFSKNYLLINENLLAKEYINRALAQEPENIWMLTHLVAVYKKERNFKEAIVVQEKIVALDADKKSDLIYLYLSNNEFDKTLKLLEEIEQEKGLSSSLSQIKNKLNSKEINQIEEVKTEETLASLIEEFEDKKNYDSLLKICSILEKENNNLQLFEFSEKGISLFPSQPSLYLTNGKALNNLQKYTEALAILKNGIDFVIEEKMEANFYTQMAIASEGSGNTNEAKKYKNLASKIKS